MKFGYLSQFFSTFAWKRVTAVEADATASNGHEFNSSKRLREILGTTTRKSSERTGIPTRFLHFRDDDDDVMEANAWLSWYDSRKQQMHRSPEWRLYYTDNNVFGRTGRARAGDFLIIAFAAGNQSATVMVAESGSTYESQLRWLFGIADEPALEFGTREVDRTQTIDLARARILETAGVVLPATDETLLKRMLGEFAGDFPTTAAFSTFIRRELPDVRVQDDADQAILAWMEREEFAFRVLERHIVGKRLADGFEDVDAFVKCSLSVHNRRKSRAGHAFENHLSEVFRAHGLAFESGVTVEDKSKPDFLFPGGEKYFDRAFPDELLSLLGAKTSCKDRWRQVLAEGAREKMGRHIITLEPAISANQLAQMRGHNLQLVLPKALHQTYPILERATLWNVATFIASVREKQRKAGIVSGIGVETVRPKRNRKRPK